MRAFVRTNITSASELLLVEAELKSGKEVIIQFGDKTYSNELLASINQLCKRFDRSLCIRFYGHYSDVFDCATALRIPDVKFLCVDCLNSASNVMALTKLQHLEALSLDIDYLNEIEILDADNFKNMHELKIASVKTKSLNLVYLNQYKNLKSLSIAENSKNIEAIGELTNLESLSLYAIKKTSLEFVNKLTNLHSLTILLGGRENIFEIKENRIENLAIDWVRGFNSLTNVSNFPNLKSLRVENQAQLTEIEFNRPFTNLIELRVLNCKNLDSISGISNLAALETLVIYQTKIDFEHFITQKFPSTLKTFGFYTAKSKADSLIKARLEEKGYYCA